MERAHVGSCQFPVARAQTQADAGARSRLFARGHAIYFRFNMKENSITDTPGAVTSRKAVATTTKRETRVDIYEGAAATWKE